MKTKANKIKQDGGWVTLGNQNVHEFILDIVDNRISVYPGFVWGQVGAGEKTPKTSLVKKEILSTGKHD